MTKRKSLKQKWVPRDGWLWDLRQGDRLLARIVAHQKSGRSRFDPISRYRLSMPECEPRFFFDLAKAMQEAEKFSVPHIPAQGELFKAV